MEVGESMHALRINGDGTPAHPLMLPFALQAGGVRAVIWLDTETFSATPIKHGTYRYASIARC
jgi:hypothetical protein